jgi:long-chain acyl-CoA synthetase
MPFDTPETTPIDESWTLYDLLVSRAKRAGSSALLEYKDESSGEFESLSAEEVLQKVQNLARGMVALGIKPGDTVAIMAPTSAAWVLLDFAIYACGGICVPIYDTSSMEQVQFIIRDSRLKFFFAKDVSTAAKFEHKHLEGRIIDEGALPELEALGKSVPLSEIEAIQSRISADDIAITVYTSGSTGRPKGVVLQHKAVISISYDTQVALPEVILAPETKLLLFLPLAHGFAHFAQFAIVASSGVLTVTSSIKDLILDLQKVQPSVLLGVPRVFEKVFNAASHKSSSKAAKIIFSRAVKAAIGYSKSLDDTSLTGVQKLKVESTRNLYDALVYRKIRHVLGGKVKYAISGGAPLNEQINHFFRGAGITILEGYGMTETVAPICVNRVGANKVGTIGLPFPGVQAAISEDGELLLNTPYTFLEYKNNKEATHQSLLDEKPVVVTETKPLKTTHSKWLATGDLAQIDADSFVKIIGRKKEIIVTAGGKNVSPAPLEALIDTDVLVAQSVVIGEGKPFISALICLEMEEVDKWCERLKRPVFVNMLEASEDAALQAHIARVVDKANLSVSRAESIRRFRIVGRPFSEEEGTLTPSMKIRRNHIIDAYSQDVEIIYRARKEDAIIGVDRKEVAPH